jgi:hypothetical protein
MGREMCNRHAVLLARVVLAVTLAAGGSSGQVSSIYGGLRLTVTDPTGAHVPGATIDVRLVDRNWDRGLETDSSGTAYFAALLPGEYQVSASAAGFAAQESVVKIRLGHEASLHIVLEIEAQRHQVTVAAETGGVDSYTIPVHTHVNATEIHGLPVNQRNFLDFVLLDAGLQRDTLRVHAVASTSGFNVMGQRPRSNSLQLDGADLNDETTGGVRGSIPMEAVQEFQILTSGYQAEYGRAAGGVVNVISKSGTNELHGTAFGFLRHRSLDATNAFSMLRNPPYTRTQYGVSLAGPIRKNRTFYFASFEQLRRQESGFSRIAADPGVFALTAAQQALKSTNPTHPAVVAAERGLAIAASGVDPILGSAPSYRTTPLATEGGVYPIGQRVGSYMVRLDQELSTAHRLATRLNYAHDKLSSLEAQNNDQIAGLLSFGRTAALTTLDPTIVASLNSVLSPTRMNDLRLSWGRRKLEMTPNSDQAPVNISGVAFIGRENILPHYRTERHIHAEDSFTWSQSTHTMKAGADVMFCPTEVEYHRLTNGLFTFAPQPAPSAPAGSPQLTAVQAYGLGLASNFVQQFGNPVADSGKRSVGLFAQDSWRFSERLTVDLGLRYDVESAKFRTPGDSSLEGVFRRLSIRRSPPTDVDNVQPRVGFAYQVAGGGKLTVRGAYGVFYDRLLNLATYLAAVGDGSQMTRIILPGAEAAAVFQSPLQKLTAYPGGVPPTGLIAFSEGWRLGHSQQANLVLSSEVRRNLTLDFGYVWVKGTHLARSRDYNPPNSTGAAAFLAAGHTQSELLKLNFLRPAAEVSEVMSFENSASSVYHGFRATLRGSVGAGLTINASYTFSKAIDDAEEIFPHTRAQDMRNLRAERGLALYDQRHRFVWAMVYDVGQRYPAGTGKGALLNDWRVAPVVEAGSGRPLNVLLGFDNNLDQEPGSDRPNLVQHGTPGCMETPYGCFSAPPLGVQGNLGRNAVVGPGFASLGLRLQKSFALSDRVTAQFIVDGFNVFNRRNVRAVNPNYQRAGEPLAAFDPRQFQIGFRLLF